MHAKGVERQGDAGCGMRPAKTQQFGTSGEDADSGKNR
jgi:hypothetical protein